MRRDLSLFVYRLRVFLGTGLPPRVVASTASTPAVPVSHPAITVVPADTNALDAVKRFLESQTESSMIVDGEAPVDTGFVFVAEGDLDRLPPTHLESLLLAAAAEDLGWAVAGWSAPARGRFGPSGEVARDPDTCEASHVLLRLPSSGRQKRRSVLGRTVPHICSRNDADRRPLLLQPSTVSAGPHRLRSGTRPGTVVRSPVQPLDAVLAPIPSTPGPRTALFLLPFLAVGGAESLLFELLRALGRTNRLLVVTTDPHLETLGQTVDACREITSHVYTLGDWLPREALAGALRHLVRRWSVESLICWNGNVLFFDEAADLKKRFPDLRILNQLFNHEGGWIEHYTPSLVASVDRHLAVNTPTAKALTEERGVPADRVVTIHHGVHVPEALTPAERMARRRDCRASLGLPEDAMVVGTFIRMHPQKRPLDIVRLARRMRAEPVHFLLVGGGPLDKEVDHELRRDPNIKLLRLPMRPDARELYDALDICLLTSSFEGLPVFLLDGLARGIPCVAPAVGDIPLLLEEGGGVVVDRPGDLESFAAAVTTLLNKDRRWAEGERGRDRVRSRFSIDRYVASYESVIFPKP
jgi:glycosyltransferase involved in cell wall biosynthesis